MPAFGYRGELTLDNTVHLRARTYEPGEGVFTTRDPLDGVAGTTTVTSPYSYADNDPNGHVDPLGLSATDADFENCLVTGNAMEGDIHDFDRDVVDKINAANTQRLGLRCLSQTATAVSEFVSDLAVPCKDLFTDPSLASTALCAVDAAGGAIVGGIVTVAPKVLRYGDELVQAVSTRIDNIGRYGDEVPATPRFVVESSGVTTDLSRPVFNRYYDEAARLDVATGPNSAVFYSGPGNRRLAEEFAEQNLRLTLEMTPGGKWLDEAGLYGASSAVTRGEAGAVWAQLSERFAKEASGVAVAFVEGANPLGIFETVEWKALLANPLITNVITGGF